MASSAVLAVDGSDTSPEVPRLLHDPKVSFEEYLHYAKESRAWDDSNSQVVSSESTGPLAALQKIFGQSKKPTGVIQGVNYAGEDIKNESGDTKSPVTEGSSAVCDVNLSTVNGVTNDEWATAARAARTATWGAVFWLLTTDILGPFSVPFVASAFGKIEDLLTVSALGGHLLRLAMVLDGLFTRHLVHLLASKISFTPISSTKF
jgi:hypothetical protein